MLLDIVNPSSKMEEKTSSILSLFKYIGQTHKKHMYIADIMTLYSNSSIWSLNRPMDENHVNNLLKCMEEEYTNINNITLFGNIVCVYVEDKNNIIIIDGQHRMEASKRFFEKNNYSFDTTIEVIMLKTESDIELIKYFNKINNVSGQIEEFLPNIKQSEMKTILMKMFKTGVYDTDKRKNRPNLTIKDLLDYYNFNKVKFKDDISLFKKMDTYLKKASLNDIFNKSITQKETDMWNKCKLINFFLGIRPKKTVKVGSVSYSLLDLDDILEKVVNT